MRTTIRIDDEVFRRAKVQAAATGRTLGDVIEDALRRELARGERQREVPPLVTFGQGGLRDGVNLDDARALREAMDRDEPTDALR